MALRNSMRFMGLVLSRVSEHRWEFVSSGEPGRAPGVAVYRAVPGAWQVIVSFIRVDIYANGPAKRAAIEKMRRYIRELDDQLVYFRAEE